MLKRHCQENQLNLLLSGSKTQSPRRLPIVEALLIFQAQNLACITLKIFTLGYKTKAIAEIEVTNGKPAILSIELELENSHLEEVTVKPSPFVQKETAMGYEEIGFCPLYGLLDVVI